MDPEFWNLSLNNEDEVEKLAQIVVDKRVENIKQVLTLHGEKSETKKQLNNFIDDFDESELYLRSGTNITIEGSMKHSYCFDGLSRNTIYFKNKIKHIMIRNCDDTRIYLNNGSVAGIDILFGSNVSIRTPKHNFTNVEESTHTYLGGEIDKDSLIHVTRSLDVFVNHKNLKVNPYNNQPLKMVYKHSEDTDRLDIGEMSISPTSESTGSRWETKLMLMGRDLSE